MAGQRRRVLVLLATAAVAAGLGLVLDPRRHSVEVPAELTMPAGRWHISEPGTLATSEDEQRRAQVLSLPYATGSHAASSAGGIRILAAERLASGVNLYCSGHAPEAFLIDATGQLLHRWRMPWERAFPDHRQANHPLEWRRVALLPNGDLVALFQGAGLVRIDRRSRLVWATFGPFFNDFHVDVDGSIWALAKNVVAGALVARSGEVLEDSLARLDPAGQVVDHVSLLRALLRDRPDLLEPLPPHADLLHSNTVVPLDQSTSTLWQPGDLLVSLREIDTLIALEPSTGTIRWGQRGPWAAQHEPVPLADGNLLLFDNAGAGLGVSRVLRFDPKQGSIVAQWGGFSSRQAGSVQALDNGNLLVTESERGRAVELDPRGEVLWELSSPHRAGLGNRLVATLWDVIRVPRPDWLSLPNGPPAAAPQGDRAQDQ